jgi:epoxyqueuosine reductase
LSAADLKRDLFRYAESLGFQRAGVMKAERLVADEEHLKRWIADGRAGEMDYLTQNPERRTRPAELLPGAKSVISVAVSYAQKRSTPAKPPLPEGRIARYTEGRDYHKTIGKRLESFVRYLQAMAPSAECRTFVDTGPLLERAVAQRAGLGFIGKNTMLITKGLGSWVFLANVITTLELPSDAPDTRSCGECRLCIDACPTQAITEPFRLDARLCIAYLTIEQDGPVPEDLRKPTGPWVFGCDICQEVCPHNTRRKSAGLEVGLAQILSIQTDEEFKTLFGGTALSRAGRSGLLRNACVAAGNLGRKDLLPVLRQWTRDRDPLVRDHAVWAVGQLEVVISGQTNASAPAPGYASPREAGASRR